MLCSKLNLYARFNVKLTMHDVLKLQTSCMCSPENATMFSSVESVRH